MKTIVISVALLISNWCTAQLNIGPVKTDSSYDHPLINELLKRDFPDLQDLSDSKNELEIRVCFMCPRPMYIKFLVFTYNDSVWNIKEYETIHEGSVTRKSSVSYDVDRYDPWYSSILSKMVDTLKQNNAFTLVSQDKLDLQGNVFDGAGYSFSFKYKNVIGGYGCYSPASYAAGNPGVKELQEYLNIQELMLGTYKQFNYSFSQFDKWWVR
jgi:hypothetical protein